MDEAIFFLLFFSFFLTKKKKMLTRQRQISASCLSFWSPPSLTVSHSAVRLQEQSPGQVKVFQSFPSKQANKH